MKWELFQKWNINGKNENLMLEKSKLQLEIDLMQKNVLNFVYNNQSESDTLAQFLFDGIGSES